MQRSRRDFSVVAALLALCLAVGGAGLSFPRLDMLLGLAALAAAAYFVLTPRSWRFDRLTRAGLGLLALIVALPLIQLIPLPPELWQRLPGRDLPRDLDAILDQSRWRPLTLDVELTVRAFLALIPAAVLFVGSLFLAPGDRVRLLFVILGAALFSAVLGILQFVTGGQLTPYPSGHSGYAIGLFVNRNHSADLSLIAMPIAAALGMAEIARGRPRVPMLVGIVSAIVVLTIAVLASTSRMGLLLLPIALLSALFLAAYRQPPWRVALPALIAIAAVGLILFVSGGFERTLIRFSSVDDPRFSYWTDIQWALQHYGLAGTGLGTFIPVYQSAESLEAVVPAITNHAHNDYLEIAMDGGVPAIALLVAFFAWLGFALFRAARTRPSSAAGATSIAAAVGILILLLSSLVDYPLRMTALAGVLAVFCAILMPAGGTAKASSRRDVARVPDRAARPGRTFSVPRLAILAALAVVASLIVQAGMSSFELIRNRPGAAMEWASWSTRAHERQSTQLLLQNRLPEALPDAFAAIRLSPISSAAVRTIGLVRLAEGDRAQGARLMDLAVTLGWRDPLTQLWAIQTAAASRDSEKALQRAEALFRQDRSVEVALVQLARSPDQDRLAAGLAARLAQRPEWRKPVFKAMRNLPAESAAFLEKVVRRLAATSAPASPDELEGVLDALSRAGALGPARRLWQANRNGQLIANGGFDTPVESGSSRPLSWDVPSANLANVEVVESGAGTGSALKIANLRIPAMVIAQTVMLDPGQYRLSYRAMSRSGAPAQVEWRVSCRNSKVKQSVEAAIPSNGTWRETASFITVPEQNCPIQTLALKAAMDTPEQELWIDNIRLDPAFR